MSWHAIFVETGKEEIVRSEIKRLLLYYNCDKKCNLLIPRRKLIEKHQGVYKETISLIFPGYIFIESDEIQEIYCKTKNCIHLIRFLRNDNYFQEIKLEEISNIIYMLDDSGVIGTSDIFIEKDCVKVSKGPLMNYQGYVKKIDKKKKRAKILFKFNGEEHLIDLSINLLNHISENVTEKELPFFSKISQA